MMQFESEGNQRSPRRFIGRRALESAFTEDITRASAGHFQVLDLVGPPGIGKTRLLEEWVGSARERGFVSLTGRSAVSDRELPLGIFVDALEDELERRKTLLHSQLTGSELQMLLLAFPGMAIRLGAGPGMVPEPGIARHQLFRTVRRVLTLLAEPSGLLIAMDGLQWADPRSPELLSYLVRRPPSGRVILVMARRGPLSTALAATMATAESGTVRHLSVPPFSREESAEFLEGHARPAEYDWLHQASGGNPLYLDVLARIGTRPLTVLGADRVHDLSTALPSCFQAAVGAEIAALPPVATLVAQAAAVVGEEFEPGLVAEVAVTPGELTRAALDQLLAEDVVAQAGPGRFRFRHPLVRDAVYATAGAAWLVGAHARAAATLAAIGAPAALRAEHLAGSAGYGDPRAAATLAEAARAVAVHGPAAGARWLDAALRIVPDNAATTDLRRDLLADLAVAQCVSGRLVEGRDSARELLPLLPDRADTCRTQAVLSYAMAEGLLGGTAESQALLEDELGRLPDRTGEQTAALSLRLAAARLSHGDHRGAGSIVAGLPAENPDRAGFMFARAALRPLITLGCDDAAGALRDTEQAGRLMDELPDAQLTPWLDIATWLCWTGCLIDLPAGRADAALQRCARAVAVVRRTGRLHVAAHLLGSQSWVLWRLGRLNQAMSTAQEAGDVARLLGSEQSMSLASALECLAASALGDDRAALRCGRQAANLGASTREWWGALAHGALALALLDAGDVDAGSAVLSAARDTFGPMLAMHGNLLGCAEAAARAEACRGRYAAAGKWADLAAGLARPELPATMALAELARATTTLASDPAASARLARAAAERLDADGFRLDAGRAFVVTGMAHEACGAAAEALALLQRAVAIFRDCGAERMHAWASRERRRLGSRASARTSRRARDPQPLSRREQDVARLVARCYTNQLIADELFISVRTVETHLTRMFAKLGVTSRVGLVNALADPRGPGSGSNIRETG